MGRLATSWDLTKTSWGVVKQDKELLWMPILSFIASIAVVLSIAGITFGLTPDLFTENGQWSPVNTVLALVAYLGLAFVGVYFHAAVVAAAHERLEGGDPTIGSALRAANQHLGKLFLWSILVATVNILLQAVRERGGMVGQIAASIAGTAWNLATFFVVPHLVFSDDGVGSSLKHSGRLFKQRWGETVVGHIGIGFAMGVLTIAWVVVSLLLLALLSGLGIVGIVLGVVLLVGGVLLLTLVGSVLSAVYKAALYRYAQGQNAGPFSGLEQAAY